MECRLGSKWCRKERVAYTIYIEVKRENKIVGGPGNRCHAYNQQGLEAVTMFQRPLYHRINKKGKERYQPSQSVPQNIHTAHYATLHVRAFRTYGNELTPIEEVKKFIIHAGTSLTRLQMTR